MENSFFVYTDGVRQIEIERLHICTWEFNNDSSLIEYGFEINPPAGEKQLSISIYIPWVKTDCATGDLYDKLSVPENSRFIFNDSINNTRSLDGGLNKLGVVHEFRDRNELCILPIKIEQKTDRIITINVNLQSYNQIEEAGSTKVYFRFWIKPTSVISMRKSGIGKSTIIYDIKVNEKRNIPDNELSYFRDKTFCKIKQCFSFNILPNKYDVVFFDSTSLKSVRTLEYESFNKYLGDTRVKKDELIVVFNKKQDLESYSFFSIYAKERIGAGQFALAILINIICGILLFIPAYRNSNNLTFLKVWKHLPAEIIVAIIIAFTTALYFTWPYFKNIKIKK